MQPKAMFQCAATLAVATTLVALAPFTGRADEPPDRTVITSVNVKEARDALAAAGATFEKVEFDGDAFKIRAALDPDRRVWFEGMDCEGTGEAMTCPELKVWAGWEIDTPAHAAALAKQLDYNYTSVSAEGTTLTLWRMDFIYGGVTRYHLRLAITEFLELRGQAEDLIWPPAKKDQPAKNKDDTGKPH